MRALVPNNTGPPSPTQSQTSAAQSDWPRLSFIVCERQLGKGLDNKAGMIGVRPLLKADYPQAQNPRCSTARVVPIDSAHYTF